MLNILRNVIRTASFGQCSRNMMGFFYAHTLTIFVESRK
nr:MAG TPA: hypothetical protein [Caudoviricetes sp.]